MKTQKLFKISQLERDKLCVIVGNKLKTLKEIKVINEKILALKCEIDVSEAETNDKKKKIYIEYEESLKKLSEEFYDKCREEYERFYLEENKIFEERRKLEEKE